MNSTHLLLSALAMVGTFMMGVVVGATTRRPDATDGTRPQDDARHGTGPGPGAAQKARPRAHGHRAPATPAPPAADVTRHPENKENVPTPRVDEGTRAKRRGRGGSRYVPVPELPALPLPVADTPSSPRIQDRPKPHDGPPAPPPSPSPRPGTPARPAPVPGRTVRAASPSLDRGGVAAPASSGTRLTRNSRRKALMPAAGADSRWLDIAAATAPGRRAHNEDAYFVDDELAVIADGVGGAPAGDLASRLAVQAVVDAWHSAGTGSVRALQTGFRQATGAIRAHAQDRPQLLGMATTLDACGLVGGTVVGAHVGDGTVWAVRQDDQIPHRLTTPHTAGGPLLRVVGSAAAARPDLWQVDAEPDMRIVMASDGLCADLGTDAAHALLVDTLSLFPQEAADELLRQALKAGGSDNITVVVADVVAEAPVARPLAHADLLPTRQERR